MSSSRAHRSRLYLAALSMDTAFFCGWAAVPFLVKRGDALHLDDADLGTLLSVAALLYVLGALFLSALWVRRDRAVVARIAGVLCGLGFVLASWAQSAWQLFLWLPLGRLALSAFWPSLMALVGEAPGTTLVARIGSFNCWWGTGKAVAFLCCGTLLTAFGDPAVCLRICGLVTVAAALLVPRSGAGPTAPSSDAAPETAGIERFFLVGLAGLFTAGCVGAIWENQFPKGLGAERFGSAFGATYDFWINAVLFSLFAGQAVGFFVLRAWTGWPHRGWTLVLAGCLVALSQLGALLSTSAPLTAVVLFAGGLGFAIFYSHSLYHAQAGRGTKVRRSGIHEGVLSLGFVLGPPVAGYAVLWTGRLEVAFEMTVGLSAICLGATAVVVGARRGRGQGRQAGPNAKGARDAKNSPGGN